MTNKTEASGVLVQPQNVLRKACVPRTTVRTPAMFLGKPGVHRSTSLLMCFRTRAGVVLIVAVIP